MGTDEKEINSIAELKNILFKKKVKIRTSKSYLLT